MRARRTVGMAWCLAAMVAVSLAAQPAQAVTFTFTGGPIQNTEGTPSFVPPGSFFTGTVTYDPNAAVSSIGGNFKLFADPTGKITFVDGPTTYTATGVRLAVTDNIPGFNASFDVLNLPGTNVAGSPAIDDLIVGLEFPFGSFVPNFLPPTSSNFSNLLGGGVGLHKIPVDNPLFPLGMGGPLTSVDLQPGAAVPEPAAAALLGFGLIGLAGFTWRRGRNK